MPSTFLPSGITLRQVVAPAPLILSPQTLISDAIARMEATRTTHLADSATSETTSSTVPLDMRQRWAEACASCVLVVKANQLVGIVTQRDVLRLWETERAIAETILAAAMTAPVITLAISEFTHPLIALNLLHHHRIDHLPMLDDRGQVVGLVTSKILLPVLNLPEAYQQLEGLEQTVYQFQQATGKLQQCCQELEQQLQERTADLDAALRERQQLETRLKHGEQHYAALAEAAVRENERQLSTLMSNLPGYIYRVHTDSNYTVEFISEGVAAITGYTQHEYLVTRTIAYRQEIHPDDREAVWQAVQEAVAHNQPYECEFRIITKTGKHKWVWERGQKVSSETGTTWIEGFVTDITARKQAELDLQSLVEGAAAVTGEDTFVKLAQYIATALGVRYSLLAKRVGEHLQTLTFWADGQLRPNFTCPMENTPCGRAMQTGSICFFTEVQRDFPGNQLLVDLEATHYIGIALKNAQNEVIGSLCVLDDKPFAHAERVIAMLRVFAARVSVELEREEVLEALHQLNRDLENRVEQRTVALRSSDARYRALMDGASDAILLSDVHGNLLEANRKAEELLGYTRAEIAQLKMQQIYPSMELERALYGFSHVIHHRFGQLLDSLVLRKDNTVVPVDITGSVIEYDNKQVFQGIFRDITERKQIEAERNRLLSILDASLNEIYIFDAETVQFQYVNQGALHNLGYSREMMRGMTVLDLKINLTLQQFRQIATPLLQKSQKKVVFESVHQRKDGSIYPVEEHLQLIRHEGESLFLSIVLDVSDRKQSDEQLRRTLRELSDFKYALDQAAIVAITDARGVITYANDRFCEISQYSRAELLGSTHRLVHSGYHSPSFIAALWSTITKGQVWRGEMLNRAKDGSLYWVDSTIVPFLDETGRVIQYLAIRTDITQRKQAELALEESERKFRAIFNQTFQFLGLLQPDGILLEVNATALSFLGATADQVIGLPFWETQWWTISSETQAQLKNAIAQAAQGRFIRYEVDIWGLNQRVITIDFSLRPLWDETGRVKLLIPEGRDISDRKRAEKQLQDLSDRLTLAIRSGAIGIWEWDIVQDVLVWDDRMHVLYGTQATEFGGVYRAWTQRLHPNDRSIAEEAIHKALQGEQEFDTEFRVVHPDGSIRCLKAFGITQRNIQGQPKRMIGINFDITDRKLAEEQLRQTNAELARATRLKDEFLANMSHELRTPLNAILGMSEGLKDQVFGQLTDRQHRAVETIEHSGSHLLELINDILDLSKIESGKLELQPGCVPVQFLCESSLAFVRQQASQKGIQINTRIPRDLGTFVVDERRMRQVLINLLNNAVKFTPEGGSVMLVVWIEENEVSATQESSTTTADLSSNPSIDSFIYSSTDSSTNLLIDPLINPSSNLSIASSSQPDAKLNSVSQERASFNWQSSHSICISVMDTGIGIAAEDIDKLFQPFVQLDSCLSRQHPGTGLGLALVRRIVELHHGQVRVSSTVRQGSCFTIRLPYEFEPGSTKHRVKPMTYQEQKTLKQWQYFKSNFESNFEPKAAESVAAQPAPSCPPLILLVEDNQANIDTLCDYLMGYGYRLLLANTGSEAIALAQTHLPDLIVMDVQLPEMDGLEATRQIRADDHLANIPIIVLTALAMASDREHCITAGANEYLTKPVSLRQLVNTIRQLLEQ